MARFSAAIFDWNGTLSDDLEVVHYAACKVLEGIGRRPLCMEEYREKARLPIRDYYLALGIEPPKDNFWGEFCRHFEECSERPISRSLKQFQFCSGSKGGGLQQPS